MTTNFPVISPPKLYMVNGETCAVTPSSVNLGVANNQAVVSGITGKIIRVMGILAQSNGAAAGTLTLKNGSGGTTLCFFRPPPNTLPPYLFPIVDSGYFETGSGTGLYADVATTAVDLVVFYIAYLA